jgi:hypothetical protein
VIPFDRAARRMTLPFLAAATMAGLLAPELSAQATRHPPVPMPPPEPKTAAEIEAEEKAAERTWGFEFSALSIDPPHDTNYVSTTFRLDFEESFHFEARRNYEDLHTGSIFAGWNFDWYEEHGLRVVPMAGVVAGDTDGIAPALLVDYTWNWLEIWSESEYVFDTDDSSDSFFYTWNEVAVVPAEWVRFGFVAQRTNTFDQELSVDRGALLGSTIGPLSLTVYWFNPFDNDESYLSFNFGIAF